MKRSFAHFLWATWANRSWSLICLERPERFGHGRSFVLSDLSQSLAVAHLIWAKWANERMSEFPALITVDASYPFYPDKIETSHFLQYVKPTSSYNCGKIYNFTCTLFEFYVFFYIKIKVEFFNKTKNIKLFKKILFHSFRMNKVRNYSTSRKLIKNLKSKKSFCFKNNSGLWRGSVLKNMKKCF